MRMANIFEAKAEVPKAIECVEFGCSLPNLSAGPQLDVSRSDYKVIYESLGVVAGVTPSIFSMVPLWMLPQALMAGNAFILKPEQSLLRHSFGRDV